MACKVDRELSAEELAEIALLVARVRREVREELALKASPRYVAENEGTVIARDNGGEWGTSGGMPVFRRHQPTYYVRLPDGSLCYRAAS